MDLGKELSLINWQAVITVTIISFVLGFVWHSLLFKKAWTKDSGTIYNSQNHGNPLKIFGLSGLLHFVAVVSLAMLIGQNVDALNGMYMGIFISLVWISTSIGVTYIFVGKTFRLFLIDAGFYVVFFAIAGLILGAWK